MPSDEERLLAIHERLYAIGKEYYSVEVMVKALDLVLPLLNISLLIEACANPTQLRIVVFYAKMAFEDHLLFNLPDLSDRAKELILELNLDTIDDMEQWKRTLRERLAQLHEVRFGPDRFNKIITKLLDDATSSERLNSLIEMTAHPNRFPVYAIALESCFYAKTTLESSSSTFKVSSHRDFVNRPVSDQVASLVNELNLCELENKDQWMQVLREHLHRIHEDRYSSEQLESLIEKLVDTLSSAPDGFLNLLEICADADRFRVYAFIMEQSDKDFLYEPVSDAVVDLVKQLNLDLMTWEEAKQALLEHATRLYGEHYGNWILKKILGVILDNLTSNTECVRHVMLFDDHISDEEFGVKPAKYYLLLKAFADPEVFFVYATAAKIIIGNETNSPEGHSAAKNNYDQDYFLPVSDSVKALVRRFNLHTQASLDQWKQAILAHLHRQYGKRYGRKVLDEILDTLGCGLESSSNLFNLLNWCADEDSFRLTVSEARKRVAWEKEGEQPIRKIGGGDLSCRCPRYLTAHERLELQLGLDKLDTIKDMQQALCGHLARLHGKDHKGDILEKVLDRLQAACSTPDRFYFLFLFCLDEERFRLMALQVKICIDKNEQFDEPELPENVKKLIFDLNLYKLDNSTEWNQALREHLISLSQERYSNEHFDRIFSKIFGRCDTVEKFYDLLDLCSNIEKFRLFVFRDTLGIKDNTLFGDYFCGKEIKALVLRNDLDKVETLQELHQALRDCLVRWHEEQYGLKPLNRILDKIFLDMSGQQNVHDLLELCARKEGFPVYCVAAKVAMEHNFPFSFEPFTHRPLGFLTLRSGPFYYSVDQVNKLGLDKLDSLAEIKQALRNDPANREEHGFEAESEEQRDGEGEEEDGRHEDEGVVFLGRCQQFRREESSNDDGDDSPITSTEDVYHLLSKCYVYRGHGLYLGFW